MNGLNYKASKTISEFLQSRARRRALVGPFGSGKSVGSMMAILTTAMEQAAYDGVKSTRFAVVRNTNRQLNDTTIRTFMQWFPNGTLGNFAATGKTYTIKRDGLFSEIMFRALDDEADLKNLLSLDLTAGWMNECREIPRPIVEGLDGRIGRFPQTDFERGIAPTWLGLWGDTNPPVEFTYWYYILEGMDPDTELMVEDNGWVVFRQPSGLSPEAENLEHLPPGYYTELAKGKDVESDFVRMYVRGEYGRSKGGKPVHPLFNRAIHLARAPLLPNRDLPILLGADFGLTPAILLKQQDAHGRVLTLDEVVTQNMGLKRAIEMKLKPLIARKYRDFRWIVTGDPAGAQRAQGDETTCKMIFTKQGFKAVRFARSNSMVARTGATDHYLQLLTEAGPAFLVSPTCTMYWRGLESGYRWKVDKNEEQQELVVKNAYSHPVEAGHYADMFFESGMTLEGEKLKTVLPILQQQIQAHRGTYSRR